MEEMLASILPMVVILLGIYFFGVLPRQRKAKKHKQMIGAIQIHDEVSTTGGIHGRVLSRKENTVTIEVAPEVKFNVDQAKIESVKKSNKSDSENRCPRCGGKLNLADRFCGSCGHPVKESPLPPPPPPHRRA